MADDRQAGSAPSPIGTLIGFDLTVPDAPLVRDFYEQVVGWKSAPLDMGGYDDYFMHNGDPEAPVAGICHQRGQNAGLPPYWIAYIAVANLDAALQRVRDLGGRIITEPSSAEGPNRYSVIQDPAGAFLALIQPGE